jgi:hypothetical protein
MGTMSDTTPFKGQWVKPTPIPERVLWTLRKGGRVAEARTRQHPLGPELVFYVDDQLLWSQVFKQGTGVALGEMSESKRREFEELGWTEEARDGLGQPGSQADE